MFSGIIEASGEILKKERDIENITFTVQNPFGNEIKVDQSIAHNGVCLTVIACDATTYKVTAIKETLIKSNIGLLKEGDKVNLERCTKLGDRLDGHIVQGHVDTTANCIGLKEEGGSWRFTFEYAPQNEHITVEKGSITINGVSLTVVYSEDNSFSVAIIPYTYEHTNFNSIKVGSTVNLEFDIIGKYVSKLYLIGKDKK